MNLREAANIAWHVRVNGFDGVSQEHLRSALAVLEQLAEQEQKVRVLLARVDIGLIDAAEAVSDFKIGDE